MAFFPDKFQSIFGEGAEAPSYEALQRKRKIADALQARAMGQQPQNWGEGVGGLMQALAYRMMDKSIGKKEDAERSRVSEALAGIRGGMGPEGITAEQLTGLGEIAGNPYAEPGTEAIAKALMRRQMIDQPQAMGPQFSGDVTMSAQNMPQQPVNGGPMDGVMPQEMPPEEGGPKPLEPPVDLTAGMPNGPISGTGEQLARGPASGPMVAEADTGTKSDAKNPITREQQSKDYGFWSRMSGVAPDIEAHEADLTNFGDKMLGGLPAVGNMMVSDGWRQGSRAAGEWIVSLLRKDTGAQVTKEEWALYGPIYMPQPGDDAGTLADKRKARKRAEDGIKRGLGPAEVMAEQLIAERAKAAPAATGDGDDDWRTKDPSTWTDEQLQEFLK